jgi:hypothetical protein
LLVVFICRKSGRLCCLLLVKPLCVTWNVKNCANIGRLEILWKLEIPVYGYFIICSCVLHREITWLEVDDYIACFCFFTHQAANNW